MIQQAVYIETVNEMNLQILLRSLYILNWFYTYVQKIQIY